jgi:hypothetical protein
LREAARLGFRAAIVPGSSRGDLPVVAGMEIFAVPNLRSAIARAMELGGGSASRADAPGHEEPAGNGASAARGTPIA